MQRSCHIMKVVIIMEMQYRLNQEKLLADHKLNKEIMIHCIARLNKKINMLYGKKIKRQAEIQRYQKIDNGEGYILYLQNEIDDCNREQDQLIKKRQTILYVVMSAYRLSFEEVKIMLRQADKEKFPTYKTIDNIVDMINSVDYSLL